MTTGEGGGGGDPRLPRAPGAWHRHLHRLRGWASGCARARARVRDAPAGSKQAQRARAGRSILGRDPESLLLPVTLPGAAAADAATAAAWRPSGCARDCARACVCVSSCLRCGSLTAPGATNPLPPESAGRRAPSWRADPPPAPPPPRPRPLPPGH